MKQMSNTREKEKKIRRMRAYADIGSHNGIFMFEMGPVGNNYPTLLHIYRTQVTKDLRPVIIEYELK